MKKDKGRKWDGKSRVSTDLYRKRWNEIFKKKTKKEKLDETKKGLRAELLAQAYFIEKGFRVFAAVGGLGPIDFIAVDKDNNVRYFDVKFKSYRKDGTKICRVNKKVKGVKIEIVYVDLFSGEISVAQHDQKEWHKRYKMNRS